MESISKKEFYIKYANKKDKGNIQAAVICAFIIVAVNLLLGIIAKNYFVLIDVLLIGGLALGIQIGKSRVCAVLLLAYSVISLLFTLILTGRVTGWWVVLVGICAVRGTFTLHKDYKEYLQSDNQTKE